MKTTKLVKSQLEVKDISSAELLGFICLSSAQLIENIALTHV